MATHTFARELEYAEEWDDAPHGPNHSRAGVALPFPTLAPPATWPHHQLRRQAGGPPGPLRYETLSFSARAARRAPTLEAAFRLRAQVFAHELGWVAPPLDGRERDRCDAVARHFVVIAHDLASGRSELAAYARTLLPQRTFMLQREFRELLDGEPVAIDATRAFEVSRFVVSPPFRRRRCVERRMASEHMLRAIAQWALARGRTEVFTVCEGRYLRALRLRGASFQRVGREFAYQPGLPVSAISLRLPELAGALRQRNAAHFAWYTEVSADGRS